MQTQNSWTCHAVPASVGKTCGHMNLNGVVFRGNIMTCEKCGCTKTASDLRKAREEQKRET